MPRGMDHLSPADTDALSMLTTFFRLDRWARLLLPALSVVVLLFAELLPWGMGAGTPPLALVGVVFWSLRAPELLPSWFCLAAGILADLAELSPLGTQALIFLLISVGLKGRRRRFAGEPFLRQWLAFGMICMMASLFQWLAQSALSGAWLATGSLLFRTISGLAVYPIVAKSCLLPIEQMAREETE